MRPHPKFRDTDVPRSHVLAGVHLVPLSIADVDRDFEAVMDSAAEIKAANPGMRWPDGLTREANLIDLAWHQREFTARRSFAWIMEDAGGRHVGCLYIYPSITGEETADVHWWWRTGSTLDRAAFRTALRAWLDESFWPPVTFRLRSE